MKLAGVLVLPLYIAPYSIPAPARPGGTSTFDRQALEPLISTNMWDNSGAIYYAAVAPRPFDFGYLYSQSGQYGVGTPRNVLYDGFDGWWTITTQGVYQGKRSTLQFVQGSIPFTGAGNDPQGSAPTYKYPPKPFSMDGNNGIFLSVMHAGGIPTAVDMLYPSGFRALTELTIAYRRQKFCAIMLPYDFDKTYVGTPGGFKFDMYAGYTGETDFLVHGVWAENYTYIIQNTQTYVNSRGTLYSPGFNYPTWRFWDWNNAAFLSQYTLAPSLPTPISIADNPALDEAFLASVNTIGAMQNGTRLFCVALDYVSFTGQASTVMLFDPVTDRYWLVQWNPKTYDAQQMVKNTTADKINVKVSSGGYLVALDNLLTNGNLGKVFHTQALSYDLNLNTLLGSPISLPCFNPCIPNLTMGN